jgi:hypothetical protein
MVRKIGGEDNKYVHHALVIRYVRGWIDLEQLHLLPHGRIQIALPGDTDEAQVRHAHRHED